MFRNGFMMNLLLIAALGVFAAFAWLSLPTPPRPQGEQAGHAHAGGAVVLADGVVLSVDRTASRITIAGDKVKFHADVASGGAFTVTRIERAAQ